MLSVSGFLEEGGKGIISGGLVAWHATYPEKVSLFRISLLAVLTIGGDPVLEAVELPAAVPDLDAGLADVNAETLPHGDNWRQLDDVGSQRCCERDAGVGAACNVQCPTLN